MNSIKFDTARFHIETGPKELFDRVHFKMKDVSELYLSGSHFQMRNSERKIPVEVFLNIKNFKSKNWDLVIAEVRVDKGKFVNSTWEYVFNGFRYWITIGFGGTVQTVVIKESSGLGQIIRNGDLFDYVRDVNRQLMLEDSPGYRDS